jgi:hypothetical protein
MSGAPLTCDDFFALSFLSSLFCRFSLLPLILVVVWANDEVICQPDLCRNECGRNSLRGCAKQRGIYTGWKRVTSLIQRHSLFRLSLHQRICGCMRACTSEGFATTSTYKAPSRSELNFRRPTDNRTRSVPTIDHVLQVRAHRTCIVILCPPIAGK